MSKYQNKNQRTALEIIFIGIFKVLWWLVKLPFSRGKPRRTGICLEDRNYIVKKRAEIEAMVEGSEIELKQAVMEADKLVDFVLRAKGYPGETFADRLRAAQPFLSQSTYNLIWEGHKVRNRLAHEHDIKIERRELGTAISNLLIYVRSV